VLAAAERDAVMGADGARRLDLRFDVAQGIFMTEAA
jgi:hypothetical protein